MPDEEEEGAIELHDGWRSTRYRFTAAAVGCGCFRPVLVDGDERLVEDVAPEQLPRLGHAGKVRACATRDGDGVPATGP